MTDETKVDIMATIISSQTLIQGKKFNMAVFFWYLEISDLSSVRYSTRIHLYLSAQIPLFP